MPKLYAERGDLRLTDFLSELTSACPHARSIGWVTTKSNVYHFAGRRDYGNTKQGAYMCEADAKAAATGPP